MTWTLPTVPAAGSLLRDNAAGQPPTPLSDDVARTTRIRALIEDLLADPRQLGPDYQPIVSVADNSTVAVKATGRGRPGTELANTLSLLEGAKTLGLVERLDWTFRSLAFEDLANRPDLELHLTPEAEAFGTLCPPRLAAAWSAARRTLRIAAEVHADAFDDVAKLRRGVAELREWGWRVVVADLGDDAAAWSIAAELRPDILQIDLSQPNRRSAAQAAGVVSLAADWGAEVMAIRVDTPSAKLLATEIGATTARGDMFAAPGNLPSAR